MRFSAAVMTFAVVVGVISIAAGTIAGPIQNPEDAIAVLTADDIDYEIPVSWDGELFHLGVLDDNSGEYGWFIEGPGFTAQISGLMNPDPSIAYGLAVTDIGAPSVFSFLFGMPIVSTGPGTTARASIVGGLNDPTGNGISITPLAPDLDGDGMPEVQLMVDGSFADMGVDVGLAQSAGVSSGGAFYGYGSYAAGPQAGPTGPFTSLGLAVAFGLSGGGDIAALTGFGELVTNVPEPSTWALGCLAGLGLLFARRRR